MATRVKLTNLERQILDRVFLAPRGFERVEDLHDALNVEHGDFVDALETLEGDGYVSISSVGGAIVVGLEDALSELGHLPQLVHAARVGQC